VKSAAKPRMSGKEDEASPLDSVDLRQSQFSLLKQRQNARPIRSHRSSSAEQLQQTPPQNAPLKRWTPTSVSHTPAQADSVEARILL
jgi:hypothetical protein